MLAVWARRRAAPLVAALAVLVVAAVFFAEWNTVSGQSGGHGWYVPGDLRGTVLAASEYLHGHFGSVYSVDTGLVTFPGILLFLGPGILVAGAVHPGIAQAAHVFSAQGPGWLPVELACVLTVPVLLVAADALAERLGVRGVRRWVLAGFEAVAAWGVVAWWGHPEDVLAVALLLAACVAVLDGRWAPAGWLLGAAVVVQPVTLVAAGLLLGRVPADRFPRSVARVAAPSVALLVPPLVANWHGTLHTLSQQPNFPTVDHATPWGSWSLVAPGIGHQVLAAGPLRLAVVLLTVEGGLWLARRHPLGPGPLVWAVGACLALRVLAEPVMVSYYVWPALGVALIAAAAVPGRWRLWACGAVAAFASVFGTAGWDGNWTWWLIEICCTGAALWLGAPSLSTLRARGSAADDRSLSASPVPLVSSRGAT